MSDTVEAPQARPAAWVGPARLIVGLIQGAIFYVLAEGVSAAWRQNHAPLHAALVLAAAFAPLVLLAGFGHLRRAALVVWGVLATALLAGLAAYDVANQTLDRVDAMPGPALVLCSAGALFIAHHLIEAADVERRLIAPYPAYFDTAWKHAVQLALSIAFVGVFWALLMLGAALFHLIGVTAFGDLLKKSWFALPVTTLAFAAAVHLTDVRVGLITGIRTLGLTLLSWLGPIMTLIVVGFLVALPFTGLKPLWATRSAAGVLLSASAALILLINAAYQDGQRAPPAILRWTVRAAAVALTPLTVIAAYALWLRIGQHGLTPQRVIASALALISACYAVGYGVAAVLPGRWMRLLERGNIVNACVVLVIFLGLFTPIADPVRLSVDDQVARLVAGRIGPDSFDFDFLRFNAGRRGLAALQRLKAMTGDARAKAIATAASQAAARTQRTTRLDGQAQAHKPIKLYPAGAALPTGFIEQADPADTCQIGTVCEAYLVDLDGDGAPEVVVNGGYRMVVYARGANGFWSHIGELSPPGCGAIGEALRGGRYTVQPPRWRDLDVGGVRLAMRPDAYDCPTPQATAPTTLKGAGKVPPHGGF